MTATTMSLVDTESRIGFERVTFALFVGFVAALQVSIAVAQALLAATLLCWFAGMVRTRTRPAAPAFFLPLAVYAGLTIVSSAFSLDYRTSFLDDKQLLLFLIVPAAYDLARGRRAITIVDVILSVGAASALYGIVQFALFHFDTLGRRPEGALTHYMTYSGILMLVIGVAAARLVFRGRERAWAALVLPALVVALALTLTRSAWVGASMAVALLLLLKDLRLAILLPVVIAILFVLAPERVASRATSMFNTQDPANQDRIAMADIGAHIVADYPLTGVGPDMVPRVYEQYRPAYAVNRINPHLHNVPLQIAAERGLPALAAWFWLVAILVRGLWRQFRFTDERTLPAIGLATVVAMLAAGLFEYNFGDSEFLMMFLVLVTLPFAARRAPAHA